MADNFTNQQRRIATEADCKARWGAGAPGAHFRCYLCGHKFKVGDGWRWVYATNRGYINFLTCDDCDGEDVLERWIQLNLEFRSDKFWSLRS